MLVIFDEMENFIERYQLPNSRGNRNLSGPITSRETVVASHKESPNVSLMTSTKDVKEN